MMHRWYQKLCHCLSVHY